MAYMPKCIESKLLYTIAKEIVKKTTEIKYEQSVGG